MSKTNVLLTWVLRILASLLMLQTLWFKFSGSEESVYIFSKIGIEPWGRIGTGIAELVAAVLLLIPATVALGALMGTGIMAGAILSHFFILGIEVMDDGGQLFIYALIVFTCCLVLLWKYQHQLAALKLKLIK
jgi:uncharacterized membrane protein YphA (DoxX/SURF4 family)